MSAGQAWWIYFAARKSLEDGLFFIVLWKLRGRLPEVVANSFFIFFCGPDFLKRTCARLMLVDELIRNFSPGGQNLNMPGRQKKGGRIEV